MKKNLCPNCKARPKKKHFNSKWCGICAANFRKRPKSTLTKTQVKKAQSMIGQMPAPEIAKHLGTSVSNLKRAFVGKSIWFKNGKYKNQPHLVKQVLAYYEEHGKKATQEMFPSVNVKCIVDRPEYYGGQNNTRQMRWTDDQLLELVKMAGMVSTTDQAKYFNRPGANAGSIKSVWSKRFGCSGGQIHGMSHCQAKYFIKASCPYLLTEFWSQRYLSYASDKVRKIYLWVDMERHLRADCPKFVKKAIEAMADFQRWLFQSDQPKRAIVKVIQNREVTS